MRKFVVGFMLLLVSAVQVEAWQPDFSFDLAGGYRRDSFKFEISGKNGVPNILTDMQWKDLQAWEISGNWKMVFCRTVYIRVNGDYAKYYHGHQYDNDFAKDDRTDQFLETKSKVHGGEAYDVSAGIGYLFWFVGEKVTIAPIVGYSRHEQHFKMDDLVVKQGLFPPGSLSGLHSNYRARWMGPWAGVDFTYDTGCHDIRLLGTVEYHFCSRFNASGHWNLRTDFDEDFRQHAWAHGWYGLGGIFWDFACNFSLGFTGSYTRWKSNAGEQKTFVDGEKLHRRFNHAIWKSWQWMGVLEYYY
jgi:hypothetical protein